MASQTTFTCDCGCGCEQSVTGLRDSWPPEWFVLAQADSAKRKSKKMRINGLLYFASLDCLQKWLDKAKPKLEQWNSPDYQAHMSGTMLPAGSLPAGLFVPVYSSAFD